MPHQPLTLSLLLATFCLSFACSSPADGLHGQGEVSYVTPELQTGFRLDRLTRLSPPGEESPAGRLEGECTTSGDEVHAFLGRTANAPDEGGLVSLTLVDREELNEMTLEFEASEIRLTADDCSIWDIGPDGDLLSIKAECALEDDRLEVEFFFEGCL